MPIRVLGVDPGYDRLGLAVMEYVSGREAIIFSTCLETDRKKTLPDRYKQIGDSVKEIISEYNVDTIGIETLFFNKNVKTALQVAEARGVILYIAKSAGCKIYEFSPQAIKIATTGYGNSDKSAMITMVQQLIPTAPKKMLDDEYDAIAVGITCLAHHGRRA